MTDARAVTRQTQLDPAAWHSGTNDFFFLLFSSLFVLLSRVTLYFLIESICTTTANWARKVVVARSSESWYQHIGWASFVHCKENGLDGYCLLIYFFSLWFIGSWFALIVRLQLEGNTKWSLKDKFVVLSYDSTFFHVCVLGDWITASSKGLTSIVCRS